MKERGILFSAENVRAILDDRKRQTRRILNADTLRVALERPVPNEAVAMDIAPLAMTAPKGSHRAHLNNAGAVTITELNFGVKPGEFNFRCPYADGLTRLADFPNRTSSRTLSPWRSCWTIRPFSDQRLWVRETWRGRAGSVRYRADGEARGKWKPAIHMPRRFARTVLDVTAVRIDRLHAIDDDDARAEGVESRTAFEALWKKINGVESWEANVWVWVVSFQRITETS